MKNRLLCFFGLYLVVSLLACTCNESVKKGIYSGVFEGLTQIHELESSEGSPLKNEPPLSYEAYERERQEMLSDSKHK